MPTTSDADSLPKRWEYAVQFVRNLPPPRDKSEEPSTREKLKMYALFKQATEGACNIPRPSWYDVVAKTKWDAWKKLEDLPMDSAREQYIAYLVEKAEAFDDSPEKREALSNLLPPSQLASKGLAPTQAPTPTPTPTPTQAAAAAAAAAPSTPPRTTTTVISSTGKSARGGDVSRSPLRLDDGLATATSTYATPGQHPRSSSNGDVFSDSLDDITHTPMRAAVAALQNELSQVRETADRANARLRSLDSSGGGGGGDKAGSTRGGGDGDGLNMADIISRLQRVERQSVQRGRIQVSDLAPSTLAVLLGIPILVAVVLSSWLGRRGHQRRS